MKKIILVNTLLLSSLFAFAQKNIVAQDTIPKTSNVLDTITELLNEALYSDTMEFFDFDIDNIFLLFKSGYIISKSEKNAIVVIVNDMTGLLKLYSIQNNNWQLTDSMSNLENIYLVNFDIIFDDYNFDGQTDIFLRASASNGYSISRGYLIIIDPKTKKFELHKEARELGNMTLDPKTKTIKSEEWNGWNDRGVGPYATVFTHKWKNGKLKTISKKNVAIRF